MPLISPLMPVPHLLTDTEKSFYAHAHTLGFLWAKHSSWCSTNGVKGSSIKDVCKNTSKIRPHSSLGPYPLPSYGRPHVTKYTVNSDSWTSSN